MMGPTHAASGAAAGIGTAIAVSNLGIADLSAPEAIVITGITAGAALVPDLDHPSATIARTFGPVTKLAAKATDVVSARFMQATSGPKDREIHGGHRGLTHVLLGLVLTALVIWGVIAVWGRWAALAVFFLFTTFMMHSLLRGFVRKSGPIVSALVAAAATWLCATYLPETLSVGVLAAAALVGGFVHIIGDAVTYSGTPNPLAPFVPVGGQRWGKFHLLPAGLRFSATGSVDRVCFFLFSAAAVVLLGFAVVSPASVGAQWAPLADLQPVIGTLF